MVHFSKMKSFPVAVAVVVSNGASNLAPEVLPQSSVNSSLLPLPCLLSNAPFQRKRRKDLLLFLLALLDHLEQHDPFLREKVRGVMTYIIRENRKGNKMHQPLACSVQRHARAIVGEYHWSQVTSIIASTKSMSILNSDLRLT